MEKISCKLIISSNSRHLQQIYTGFSELKEKKILELSIVRDKCFRKNNMPLLEVIINNNTKVIYDTLDGFNFVDDMKSAENLSFLSKKLDTVDFYFKRSYDSKTIAHIKHRERIFPLGLNYYTSSPYNVGSKLYLSDGLINKIKLIIQENKYLSRLFTLSNGVDFYFDKFEYYPRINPIPKILFMCRAWEPDASMPHVFRQEIEAINESRAQCIRLCRKKFRDKFWGGFSHDSYTKKCFPDCLLPHAGNAAKKIFLERIKASDICIATTGLHGSIGWKFAEFVAASKAIVSECLQYELPGDFTVNKNYLEFETPEDCVKKIDLLLQNKNIIFEMMQNNYRYYNNYIKPENLILNTLLRVTAKLLA